MIQLRWRLLAATCAALLALTTVACGDSGSTVTDGTTSDGTTGDGTTGDGTSATDGIGTNGGSTGATDNTGSASDSDTPSMGDCAGKTCGDDGMGGSCGTCGSGNACNACHPVGGLSILMWYYSTIL